MLRIHVRRLLASTMCVGLTPFLFGAAILVVWFAAAPCVAITGMWLPGQQKPGVNNEILGACAWDPDGAGPLSSVLVAGGLFTFAGATNNSSYVAEFDGEKWSAIPSLNRVTGQCVPSVCNGTLYINGDITLWEPDGSSHYVPFAKYDGSQWVDARNGLSGIIVGPIVYNGELVASDTYQVSGVTYGRVVRWDGAAWQEFGSLANFGARATVMCVYNGDLIVGGAFSTVNGVSMSRIARWDGSSWNALSSGINGIPQALTVFEDSLVVGGSHTIAGGLDSPKASRWNGTEWSVLGTGLTVGSVSGLKVFDGLLYASGPTWLGGRPVNMVAWWDESLPGWRRAGTGLSSQAVRANGLEEFNGALYVFGLFDTAGGLRANDIARWTGTTWEVTGQGLSGPAHAFTSFDGELVAAGAFAYGSEVLNSIGHWDGLRWRKFGAGFAGPDAAVGTVLAVHVHNGQLFAGGNFKISGAADVSNIASWDGSVWQPVGGHLGGSNDGVFNLVSYAGQLVAGGSFYSATNEHPNYLAQWDGTAWQPIGGLSPASTILDLDIFEGNLLACGQFTSTSVGQLKAWNGLTWTDFPKPTDSAFRRISVVDGQLLGVATLGQGFYSAMIWNGASWDSLPMLAGNPEILDITSYAGTVVVATANGVFAWDGTSWERFSNLGSGDISGLAQYNGELLVGGTAGSPDDSRSDGWSRWTSAGGAWFSKQPLPVVVHQGQPFSVHADLASGYGASTLRWYRNDQPVLDGPEGASPNGGVAAGALTDSLTVSMARPSDSGRYSLKTTYFGTVTYTAEIRVLVACPSDLDDGIGEGDPDGGVDINDLLFFLGAFEAGVGSADLDNGSGTGTPDGGVDINDLLFFLGHFEAGC